MNDRQLRAFLTVVDCGSFSAAARKLYISPQAMLQQINLLEHELNSQLLVRSSKGVTPTKAGQLFYQGAADIVTQADRLIAQVQAEAVDRHSIRIGVFEGSDMMNEACANFSRDFPNITQEYKIIPSENWISALQDIYSGEIDIFEHVLVSDELLAGLTFTPLIQCRCCCVMGPTHPLADRESLTIDDLTTQFLFIHDRSCVPGLGEALRQKGYQGELISNDQGPLAAFAICGKGGIFIVPTPFASRFKPLRAVPLDEPLYWTFGVICKEKPNLQAQLFLKAARATFSPA